MCELMAEMLCWAPSAHVLHAVQCLHVAAAQVALQHVEDSAQLWSGLGWGWGALPKAGAGEQAALLIDKKHK